MDDPSTCCLSCCFRETSWINRKNVLKKIRNNILDKNKADVENQPAVDNEFDSANLFVETEVHFCYSSSFLLAKN